VIFLVEILVILVRLSVEHLVEMAAGVHLWWFVRGCEPFQYEMKGAQSLIESTRNMVSTSGGCQISMELTFRFLAFQARFKKLVAVVCGKGALTTQN
jgi:hypothetical protein